MAHITFSEYLDKNNKLQTSGKVKTIADYEGKAEAKPAKEKKHKDAGGKGQVGEPKPYHPTATAKDPNKGKLSGGFAEKGEKSLKYKPDTDVPQKVGEGGKKKATWPKTKTQEWVDRTKDMSLAEFTQAIRKNALKGLSECECQIQPHNSIKETVSICKCNKHHVSSLVREMKRNGLFNKLFAEMIQHPEAYSVLAKYMEHDESYARKLVKAMNEMISPPMGGMGGPMDGPPVKKKKKHMPPMMGGDMGGDMSGDDHPDDMDMNGDEDMPHDDMDGDEEGMDDMGGDDHPDDMDMPHDDDMGGDMGGDDHPDMDGDEDDMGMDGDMDGDEEGMDDMPAPPHDKIGKLPGKKKKHAADHLLGAMRDQPSMHGSLKSMMGGM